MIVAKSMEVRDNFRSWCAQVAEGEVVQISRPGNNYVYLISQETYENISAKRRIAAYSSYLYGKDKIANLKRLSDIEALPDNWNNNGADKISENLIKCVRKLLMILEIQPEIFPTALNSIQFEYDNSRRDHMEIEISDSDEAEVFIVTYFGEEIEESIPSTYESLAERIVQFYG